MDDSALISSKTSEGPFVTTLTYNLSKLNLQLYLQGSVSKETYDLSLSIQSYVHTVLSTTILQRAAVWLNALACLERFLVISFPLQSALLRPASGKKLVFVIVAIFLTSLLAHVHLMLQREIQPTGGDAYKVVFSSLLLSNPTAIDYLMSKPRTEWTRIVPVFLSRAGSVSKETYDLSLYIQSYVHTVLSVCTLVCSIVNVATFSRHRSPTSVSYFLGTTVLQRAVVCLNALACLERFIVISFPLQSALLRPASGKKLVFVIIAIFLCSLLAHAYLTVQTGIQSTGGDTYTFVPTSLLLSNPTAFYNNLRMSRGQDGRYPEEQSDGKKRENRPENHYPINLYLQGSVSKETYDLSLYIQSYVHTVLSVCTLVCSIVNVATFSRHRSPTSVSYFLGVCIADALTALIAIVFLIITTCTFPFSLPSVTFQYYFSSMGTTILQRAAVWLNALACLERFLVISFPLQSALLRPASGKKLVFVIVAIFLTSLLLHAYLMVQREIQPTGGDTYTFVSTSLLLSNPTAFYSPATINSTIGSVHSEYGTLKKEHYLFMIESVMSKARTGWTRISPVFLSRPKRINKNVTWTAESLEHWSLYPEGAGSIPVLHIYKCRDILTPDKNRVRFPFSATVLTSDLLDRTVMPSSRSHIEPHGVDFQGDDHGNVKENYCQQGSVQRSRSNYLRSYYEKFWIGPHERGGNLSIGVVAHHPHVVLENRIQVNDH
ncbi:hypothetical protein C0Q70_05536 [Pomacea canaliculata]|uniref:G-protein coupled receptors family 1 profile domain-containing protein n=1 Tax=Pomacea canaliculata TaxID=400727 RepID=A0A2T7PLK4_POMCA|nr:hypothetical protein C0Q70_05536 [Pomacea canaliculata]